jgi:predicted short-subunit dehydrogenase-like oxidoreductase (DUF2520 family)
VAEYVFGLQRPDPGTTAAFLSVPDEGLEAMAVALASQGEAPGGCPAFHLSGALGTDPLAPLHGRGYSVGAIHPLQSLADPVLGADQLRGTFFSVSGDREAVATAKRLLHPLAGGVISVPVAKRPLYHAAAVFASNYLAGLIAAAGRLMAQAGVSEDEALDAILPLARGSLENLHRLGPVRALTGPVSRGDTETVRLHLRTLEPRERGLYASLGLEILRLAQEGGLGEDVVEELEDLLKRER